VEVEVFSVEVRVGAGLMVDEGVLSVVVGREVALVVEVKVISTVVNVVVLATIVVVRDVKVVLPGIMAISVLNDVGTDDVLLKVAERKLLSMFVNADVLDEKLSLAAEAEVLVNRVVGVEVAMFKTVVVMMFPVDQIIVVDVVRLEGMMVFIEATENTLAPNGVALCSEAVLGLAVLLEAVPRPFTMLLEAVVRLIDFLVVHFGGLGYFGP